MLFVVSLGPNRIPRCTPIVRVHASPNQVVSRVFRSCGKDDVEVVPRQASFFVTNPGRGGRKGVDGAVRGPQGSLRKHGNWHGKTWKLHGAGSTGGEILDPD